MTGSKQRGVRCAPAMSKEIKEMLLYEELARARIRDIERSVWDRRFDREARAARARARSGRRGLSTLRWRHRM